MKNWILTLATGLVALAMGTGAHSTQVPMAAATLTAQQAQQDARVLQRALRALHPALTKYRTPAEMDAAFARFETRAQASRTSGEMYLAATELAAAIRCGHTWTNVRNQQGAARATLLEAADKLPLNLTVVEGRWLVLASADASMQPGDEIVAIQGQPVSQVLAQLMPYLRADGSSDGKRLRQLNHDRPDTSQLDILLPLLLPPEQGVYALEVQRANGSRSRLRVPAMTLAAREQALRAQGVKPQDERWTFEIRDQVGYLVLPTFSFWNSPFDWKSFLQAAFLQLNAQGIPHLVIDIRANEGGDGAIGNLLLSHLIQKPLGYFPTQSVSNYERVPYPLVRYLDTWDMGFFDRTGDVEPITEGTARGKFQLKSRPVKQQFIEPVAQPYKGTVYALVGPENSSATFVLADLLQRSRAARLVGQATGGNQRGLNGGQLLWVTLPNSGVAVDIPLLAAHYTDTTPDTSVTPDIAVQPSFTARAAGLDQEMQTVRALIGASRL